MEKTEPNKQYSQKEVQKNLHIQSLQAVFGRNDSSRTDEQKYVVKLLENEVDQRVFLRGQDGSFCHIYAARIEGARELARSILAALMSDPVQKVDKPHVTK